MSSGSSSNSAPPLCTQAQRCEYFFGAVDGSPCRFPGDPDIAGIGIIVAFLVAAWLAFAVVLYSYFFVDDAIGANRMNQLDQYLIQAARRTVAWSLQCVGVNRRDGSSREENERAMHLQRVVVKRTLLSLSDQQLVTGIAVLSVGYAQMSTITEYHFQLLACFAWLSFTVYQCAAVVIESIFHMSRFMALWRGIWIVLMLALLFVSTLATFNDYWLYSFGTPSACIWENIQGNYTRQLSALVLITVFAILWGGIDVIYGFFPSRSLTWVMRPVDFLAVVMLAFTAVPIFVYQRLRELEANPASTTRRFAYRALRIICYPLAVLTAVAVQLLTSRMLDLLRVWSMGLFYSTYIFFIRDLAPRAGLMDDEDGWAFGQAVAVFMLLLPFFGIIEAYLDEKSNNHLGLNRRKSTNEEAIALQGLSTAEQESADQPVSTFLAQTRTLGQGAASSARHDTSRLKHSRFVADGADSTGDDYRLIQHRTDSSTLPTSLRHLESSTLPSVLGDSARFQRWRENWPIIEMLASFEREHYQSRWFGPLMVGVVVVLWALATVLGFFLLMLDPVN